MRLLHWLQLGCVTRQRQRDACRRRRAAIGGFKGWGKGAMPPPLPELGSNKFRGANKFHLAPLENAEKYLAAEVPTHTPLLVAYSAP